MYTSQTDYAALYDGAYSGKMPGATSFQESLLIESLADLAESRAGGAIVDVGAGSGRLTEALAERGLKTFAFDFVPARPEILPFDLTGASPAAARSARAALKSEAGSWLLTCLDVLEHIDPEDVAAALFNLSTLTQELAVFSISTRPSSEYNRFHSTILPRRTWLRLLEDAGFEIIEDDTFRNSVRQNTQFDPHHPASWLIRYWRDADLFRDVALGEPWYVLCRKRKPLKTLSPLQDIVADRLDIRHRFLKRQEADLSGLGPIVLNITHFQDYFHFRPLLDIIPRAQCTVLMRESEVTSPLQRSAILGWFRRCGVRCVLYRTLDEVPWAELAGALLLSASESTASLHHALSQGAVEAARLHGCRTALLQHGVWVLEDGPFAFASDQLLAWGNEHAKSFLQNRARMLGADLPRGLIERMRVAAIGSPKFAESTMPGALTAVQDRLGLPVDRFDGVVLIGTNLHWPEHRQIQGFTGDLHRLAESRPDQLFLLKTHPCEQFYDYEVLAAENLYLYDDVLAILTDFHTPRLIRCADVVASSLSSLLIDGAVAGKPVFQYDTGNRYAYAGITPEPMASLEGFITEAKLGGRAASAALVEAYADADHAAFFQQLPRVLGDVPQRDETRGDTAERLASLLRVEVMWSYAGLCLADYELLSKSGLFHEGYYLEQAGPELSGMGPLEHFLTIGKAYGLDPHPCFDSHGYAERYLDGSSRVAPVVHYLREGARLGYSPHPLFDVSWYMTQDPDLELHHGSALLHYLREGEARGFTAHPFFDGRWYLATNPDVAEAGWNGLIHFLITGVKEGRDPHPRFSISAYLGPHPDLHDINQNPLIHYLEHGAGERRLRSNVRRWNALGA